MIGGAGEQNYNEEIIQLVDIFFIINQEDYEKGKENNITPKCTVAFLVF